MSSTLNYSFRNTARNERDVFVTVTTEISTWYKTSNIMERGTGCVWRASDEMREKGGSFRYPMVD